MCSIDNTLLYIIFHLKWVVIFNAVGVAFREVSSGNGFMLGEAAKEGTSSFSALIGNFIYLKMKCIKM